MTFWQSMEAVIPIWIGEKEIWSWKLLTKWRVPVSTMGWKWWSHSDKKNQTLESSLRAVARLAVSLASLSFLVSLYRLEAPWKTHYAIVRAWPIHSVFTMMPKMPRCSISFLPGASGHLQGGLLPGQQGARAGLAPGGFGHLWGHRVSLRLQCK